MHNLSSRQQFRVDEENPYWISFSDLMSALLVIFILASVALIIQLTQTQKEYEDKNTSVKEAINKLQDAEKARYDIISDVRDELKRHSIIVEIADNHTVLRIPESTLSFQSGSYDIPDNEIAQNAILLIGKFLHEAINKPFDNSQDSLMRFEYLDTVFIEGHTDSVPSKKIKGNWGLSSFRAISIWEHWTTNLNVKPAFTDMKNAFGSNIFSISGYASSRRIQMEEENESQKRKNRRIDIRFTVKKPAITQLESIIANENSY